MLSSEISTLISGRYIEIPMLPLSFKEYVSSTGEENDLSKKYLSYIENSSSPYAAELAGQPKEIKDYLEGIYNTIVIKDISSRKKVQDTMMLESVARFVFDNIGNPLSTKKIADTMTSDGRKIECFRHSGNYCFETPCKWLYKGECKGLNNAIQSITENAFEFSYQSITLTAKPLLKK